MGKASEYRQKLAQRRAERPGEDVPLPSGETWKLARPEFQTFLLSGRCPQGLVRKAIAAWQGTNKFEMADAEQLVKGLDEQGWLELMDFMRLIVCDACIQPRVMLPDEMEQAREAGLDLSDTLAYEEVEPDDRRFIFNWCMEGEAHEGLESFRAGQERGTAGNRDDGAELRPATVSTAAN